jgi:hypothetical protein
LNDGGNYYAETVPFSFAFAVVRGREVAIHRTAWNRLDVSDPSTGKLLTARNPTNYQRGEERPVHSGVFAMHEPIPAARVLERLLEPVGRAIRV